MISTLVRVVDIRLEVIDQVSKVTNRNIDIVEGVGGWATVPG